jgi:hypothetical protein
MEPLPQIPPSKQMTVSEFAGKFPDLFADLCVELFSALTRHPCIELALYEYYSAFPLATENLFQAVTTPPPGLVRAFVRAAIQLPEPYNELRYFLGALERARVEPRAILEAISAASRISAVQLPPFPQPPQRLDVGAAGVHNDAGVEVLTISSDADESASASVAPKELPNEDDGAGPYKDVSWFERHHPNLYRDLESLLQKLSQGPPTEVSPSLALVHYYAALQRDWSPIQAANLENMSPKELLTLIMALRPPSNHLTHLRSALLRIPKCANKVKEIQRVVGVPTRDPWRPSTDGVPMPPKYSVASTLFWLFDPVYFGDADLFVCV